MSIFAELEKFTPPFFAKRLISRVGPGFLFLRGFFQKCLKMPTFPNKGNRFEEEGKGMGTQTDSQPSHGVRDQYVGRQRHHQGVQGGRIIDPRVFQ